VKITQDKGAIFHEYGTAGDNSSKRLIDAGSKGVTVQVNGQDATLSVNGMSVQTDGLRLKMATQDIQADFTFNQGTVGSTTLAQVGYDAGSIFTKIGALNLSSTVANEDGLSGLLCNAGHVTNETIDNFGGGMQLQLGEGAGDQNRTVVAIKSLASNELGRVTKGGYWETGSAVYSERMFTMQDVMGGGLASLKTDPTLSMSIIEQAIADVTEVRAQIGAVQSNLLQTNSNNLSVTMENIQKTESGIRDADMADEMTEFTKQQVLQNAAMSMMGNANANAQNVLQLLR
jgi:flagellin